MFLINNFINLFNKLNNIINITPSKSISLYEIAKIVSKGRVDIRIKNPVLNNEYTGDNTKLLNEINSFEFTSIETGLKKLYQYKQGEIQNEKQYI